MMRLPLLALALIAATPSAVPAYAPEDARDAPALDACPSGDACPETVARPALPPFSPGPLGLAAIMRFDGTNGPPIVLPGPGWVCSGVYPAGGFWEVECYPVSWMLGLLPECTEPYAIVGGTPLSWGEGDARVSCREFFGGFASSQCHVEWQIEGSCRAVLHGFRTFPLRCAARVTGTTIGGVLYAICGH